MQQPPGGNRGISHPNVSALRTVRRALERKRYRFDQVSPRDLSQNIPSYVGALFAAQKMGLWCPLCCLEFAGWDLHPRVNSWYTHRPLTSGGDGSWGVATARKAPLLSPTSSRFFDAFLSSRSTFSIVKPKYFFHLATSQRVATHFFRPCLGRSRTPPRLSPSSMGTSNRPGALAFGTRCSRCPPGKRNFGV